MASIINLREKFKSLAELFNPLIDTLDSGNLTLESLDLTQEVENLNIYNTPEKLKDVTKRLSSISKTMESFKEVSMALNDIEELLKVYENETDESILNELEVDINKLEESIEYLVINSLLIEENDKLNAIIKIRAEDLSLESADFVKELYTMYIGFAKLNNWNCTLLDFEENGNGYKSISFVLTGENAYGLLKSEIGAHKELKQSEYSQRNNKHGVFASVLVIPEIEEVGDVELKEDDIKIETYRSSGAGGQHVNTTDSAVRITHIPTGIIVTCQDERSQTQNKETAKKVLISKLIQLKNEEKNYQKGMSQSGMEFSNPIRTYTFFPNENVKDNRTNYETSELKKVLNGDINALIFSYLRWIKN